MALGRFAVSACSIHYVSNTSWSRGSGQRMLRSWMKDAPCCEGASLHCLSDGRMRCARCGMWFSASHSALTPANLDGRAEFYSSPDLEDSSYLYGENLKTAFENRAILVLARSCDPVGIDVQFPRSRRAALRWLARVSGLQDQGITECDINHWCLAEAQLKAIGQAKKRPHRGEIWLPKKVENFGAGKIVNTFGGGVWSPHIRGNNNSFRQVNEAKSFQYVRWSYMGATIVMAIVGSYRDP